MITQELNRGWYIQPCMGESWKVKTDIPCSVLHAMLDAKLAPDPFYRKNEYEVRELLVRILLYVYFYSSKGSAGTAICGVSILRTGHVG